MIPSPLLLNEEEFFYFFCIPGWNLSIDTRDEHSLGFWHFGQAHTEWLVPKIVL
jgi:hypothetical protein